MGVSLASCTIVELKAEKCETKDLTQVLKHEDWLIKEKCSGDSEMVRSVIVAYHFGSDVVSYVRKREQVERRTVKLVEYRCTDGTPDLRELKRHQILP